MANEPEAEVVKAIQLELDEFGKRNAQQFHIVRELELCMRSCKTPEVGLLHSEAMRKAAAELVREENTLNNKVTKALQAAAKKSAKDKNEKKTDFKSSETAIRKAVDKFTSKYLGGIKGLKPKAKVKGKVDDKGHVKVKEVTFGFGFKFGLGA